MGVQLSGNFWRGRSVESTEGSVWPVQFEILTRHEADRQMGTLREFRGRTTLG